MTSINWKNPKYNGSATIDCEIEHPSFGWIPFTADPVDIEEAGRRLHQEILDSGVDISPYEEEPISIDDQVRALKIEKDQKLSSIKVTTSEGNEFDGDESSQNRMRNAVFSMEEGESKDWILADNSVASVDKEELSEALELASDELGSILLEYQKKIAELK